jgi:ketosteroid isomerase-like protein
MQSLLFASVTALIISASGAAAAEFSADSVHSKFIEAFNSRDWTSVKQILADDAVFHRANAEEVFVGSDAVMRVFKETIGNDGEWNVKFAKLDSDSQLAGKDGKVVERGDLAITAGAGDASCYAGSYMMTWSPESENSWKLQTLAWQDVETDPANCQ